MIRVCYGVFFFFFQAEDGIRDLVRSRGLGDVYKRQFEYDIKYFQKLMSYLRINLHFNKFFIIV